MTKSHLWYNILYVLGVINKMVIVMDLESLRREQLLLQQKIHLDDMNTDDIKLIAGVDVAYFEKDNEEYGVCCIDIFDMSTFNFIEKETFVAKIDFPYIPGYLSYRELPIILGAYEKIKNKPDIFMLDGNGYLHQNNMGIATMFSLTTNEKSIGVAKSFYNFASVNFSLEDSVLSTSPIVIDNQIYGYAMRSRENCNPIFISPGNGISFENCIEIVKKCLSKESRIPIPTRIADLDTHIERKKLVLTR